MPTIGHLASSRRTLLKTGAALAAAIPAGALAGHAWAQGKAPTKVLDFTTFADMAKAEQEGALVFYCHENEAGTSAIAEAFGKAFPKIRTSYVRAQTGALYTKILAERSAGRYDCDAIQLSDLAPMIDFQKRGGFEQYVSTQVDAYKPGYLSNPAGSFFWTGMTFAGLAYNKSKVKPEDAPKTWKDLLNPLWRNAMSCKIISSGTQYVQWYELRKLYGDAFWKEFAKQRPHGFDSRVQLFDRLAKGDDKVCGCAEYAAYTLYKDKAPDIVWVAPDDGVPGTSALVGAVSHAPHPECAKLFIDWAMSLRGQTFYQNEPNLNYGSLRSDAPAMPTGLRLRDFKLLAPDSADLDDYLASRDIFVKQWDDMLGL
jgi:iron(III) transport system substrate-binding protein